MFFAIDPAKPALGSCFWGETVFFLGTGICPKHFFNENESKKGEAVFLKSEDD